MLAYDKSDKEMQTPKSIRWHDSCLLCLPKSMSTTRISRIHAHLPADRVADMVNLLDMPSDFPGSITRRSSVYKNKWKTPYHFDLLSSRLRLEAVYSSDICQFPREPLTCFILDDFSFFFYRISFARSLNILRSSFAKSPLSSSSVKSFSAEFTLPLSSKRKQNRRVRGVSSKDLCTFRIEECMAQSLAKNALDSRVRIACGTNIFKSQTMFLVCYDLFLVCCMLYRSWSCCVVPFLAVC